MRRLKRWLAKRFSYQHQFVRRWLGGHWEKHCYHFPDGWEWCCMDGCGGCSKERVERDRSERKAIILGPANCEDWPQTYEEEESKLKE